MLMLLKMKLLCRVGELTPDVRNATMMSMLEDLPSLLMSNEQLKAQLMNLPFLPTRSGSLAPPRLLYDPRNPQLITLLDADKSFPIAPFDAPEVSTTQLPSCTNQVKMHAEEAHCDQHILTLLQHTSIASIIVPGPCTDTK